MSYVNFFHAFYTSYKGWKLKSPMFTGHVFNLLFILPIRDGNHLLQCQQTRWLQLFILPIRDGNNEVAWHDDSQVVLFILPIRDGNSESAFYAAFLHGAFYTSYKGWKLL